MTVDNNLHGLSTLRSAIGKDLHFFQRDGYWAAFGRISGVVLSLDEIEASILQDFVRGDDIQYICQKHSTTVAKFVSVLNGTIARIGNKKVTEEKLQPVRSFLVIVTETCNMACTYCYGRFGQKSGTALWMDSATGRRVAEVAGELGVGQIAFFGGEPLVNFTAVRETVQHAEELGLKLKFGMTTNGTLVTEEIANFCRKYNIRVSVSVDGPEASHNLTRRYPDGSGTFTDVERGIERLKMYDLLDFIEVTYSMKHPLDLETMINDLKSYCENITVSCVEGPADAVYRDEIVKGTRLKKYYHDMLSIVLRESQSPCVLGVVELVDALISPLTIHRPYICSGVMRRVTIAPDGRFYPCPETIKDCFCFGSVWDDRSIKNLENERKRVLRSLLKKGGLESYWFTNLVDTCFVRITKDENGMSVLSEASTFSDCLEDFIVEIIQMNPSEFRIDTDTEEISNHSDNGRPTTA